MSVGVEQLDPFGAAEVKLWNLLCNHDGFSRLVSAGNRIGANPLGSDVDRDGHIASDLPEARLVPAGGGFIGQSSTSQRVSQVWALEIDTDAQQAREQLFPIKWQVIRALALLRSDATYINLGLSYVIDARAIGHQDQRIGEAMDRSDEAWQTAILIQVDFNFSQEQLETSETPA